LSGADIGTAQTQASEAISFGPLPGWLWLGIGLYALLLINGNPLLNDPDTYWHIAVGQWMLDHGAFPRVDIYSFSRAGDPWISTSWLAQVALAAAYDLDGWSGPVVLTALASAATFALLASILGARLPGAYAITVAVVSFALTAPHLLARPHVLALPLMLLWAHGLLHASERCEPPSPWLLPVIALWSNLHGSFVFGLALAGAVACDAAWNAEAALRRELLLRWIAFGAAAVAASCVTPYGWDSILASRKILGLGELLHVIDEWRPAEFSRLTPFEAILLVAVGGSLHSGAKLSPPRIVLVLGLLHMALSHVRNAEILALLTPLVVMTPLAAQFGLRPRPAGRSAVLPAAAVAFGVALALSTWALAAKGRFSPPGIAAQTAAVDALKAHHAKHVLNDLSFAGVMISRNVPVFIDGRAELYGEQFGLAYHRALNLKDVDAFLDLLKAYDIDAVVLTPDRPAASLLDRIGGWQRVYADDSAVLYVRDGN
jgi:hypothetical protein